MSSPSFVVKLHLSRHSSGWCFLANILCFYLISSTDRNASALNTSKASLLEIMLAENLFLRGGMLFLSCYNGVNDACYLGGTPAFSVNESTFGSLSSLLLNYPLSLCSPCFAIFSYCETFSLCPSRTSTLPLRPTSGTLILMPLVKESLMVRECLPSTFFLPWKWLVTSVGTRAFPA